jgi:hypothetical protein
MNLLSNPALRRFFSGRRRFQIDWFFFFLLILSARQYPQAFGTAVCFVGATLRFWASGFLRKEKKLAVGGPYSFTRNPLYLGRFIMLLGATMSVGAWALAAVMSVVFFLNYHYVIEHEELKLGTEEYFGPVYFEYKKLVPRFIPALTPAPRAELERVNPDPEVYRFSLPLANENRAMEAYVSFFGLILGMAVLVFVKKSFHWV